MKYIIFRKRALVVPVIFNDMINHSDVKVGEGFEPVSAGFCFIRDGQRAMIDLSRLGSESLDIDCWNKTADSNLINLFLRDYPVSLFLDDKGIYSKAPRKGYKFRSPDQKNLTCTKCGCKALSLEMVGIYGTDQIYCRE